MQRFRHFIRQNQRRVVFPFFQVKQGLPGHADFIRQVILGQIVPRP